MTEPDESGATARDRREEPGAARPSFARDFPRDDRLDALVRAFEAGDFARVRALAPALAKSAEDPEVKRAAELLRARIEPDPIARALLLVTALLLVALSAFWIMRGH